MRKTFRIKLQLEGDPACKIYRTDGIPTNCCSVRVDYFCWEKNTKYNSYNGWGGYVNENSVKASLKRYNPDNLIIN